MAYGFFIDGVPYPITLEDAAAIADRLAHRHRDDPNHPAYAAQVMVDAMVEGEAATVPFYGIEKDELFGAIQDWLDDAGVDGVPEAVQDIRYGVFGEAQDQEKLFPPGKYLILFEEDGAEHESVQRFQTPPVIGQPLSFERRTVIVDVIRPTTPGAEYVGVIRASFHPG